MAGEPPATPLDDAASGHALDDGGGRWAHWLWLPLVILATLAGLLVAGLWFVSETARGRAFVAGQVSALTLESGLSYRIGRLDGSLLSAFTVHDLAIHDLKGELAVIPRAEVRWEPLALLGGRIVIGEAIVPEIRMRRQWALNPRNPDDPILPDIRIRIDRFAIRSLVLEEPVLGREEVLGSTGRIELAAGRLLMDVQVRAARGDRLLLLVDAEPDRDRFDLDVDVRSPADGALTAALGLAQPVTLQAEGTGSWSRWRGDLTARVGEAPIADLSITADDGRFRLMGNLSPAMLLPDAAKPFITPSILLDATGSRVGDRIDLKFVASAPAFALSGSGGLDVEQNQLIGARADLLVKKPDLLSPDLSAANLRLAVTADGPARDPAIGWRLTADRVGFAGANGPLAANGLVASGDVRLSAGTRRLQTTLDLSARSLAGLPPELDALMRSPRLSATLEWNAGTLGVRRGTLKTTMLTAGGSGVRRPDGSIDASLSGSVTRLAIDGLGVISLSADARVRRAPGGAVAADGRFDVRTVALANQGLADALGGPARLQGGFRLAADGTILVSGARLDSPQWTLANGTARYDPAAGRFALDIAGASKRFGPISVVASGTARSPTATIRMASPDFGVGLTSLVADIAPTEGGIAIAVTGNSPEGPLDGRGRLLFGDGRPLVADIERLTFAGISASGLLTQTPAGPFAGTLSVAGQGIDGSVALSDRSGVQAIAVAATARAARLPFDTPVQISNGTAMLQILLTPGSPQVAGTFELNGVRRDALVLNQAMGKFSLDDDRTVGRIQLSGRYGNGQPFQSVLAVQGIPDGYAVALDGSVGRTPVKLAQPARILRRDGGGWEVQGTRLILPGGSLLFSGEWRDPIIVRLVLDDVDLRVLNGVSRDLGLSGTASGQLNLRWDEGYPVPLGAANLSIRKLDRAGIGGVSIPVDIELSARSSTAEGILIGGDMRWQGNQLGRMLVKLAPADSADPARRLLAGTLSGGVRYNGPVEPLWALTGLSGQELRGPLALGADVGGTLENPTLAGQARGAGLVYRNAALGTEITGIAFEGRFRGPELELTSLTGKTAGGSLSGAGRINVNPTGGSIDLGLQLNRARLADSDTLSVTLSGPLRLQGEGRSATLSGNLRVDTARIQLVQFETSEVLQLTVRRAGDARIPPPTQNLSASALALDIKVVADDRIQVEGMGLDSLWRADMAIRGTAAQPRLIGTATLASGDFTFASSRFDLTRGRVVFNGAPMDSAISIEAETQAADVTAFVSIGGTARQPEIRFRSSPALPEDEILARLLFGTSVAQLSVTEAVQLATAVAGLQSGVDTMGKIRRSVGVDRLRLVGEDAATGMGTGLAIGKRLTRNVYVEVLTDSEGNTLATLQWSLSRTLSLLLELSSLGQSSANLRYQRDY